MHIVLMTLFVMKHASYLRCELHVRLHLITRMVRRIVANTFCNWKKIHIAYICMYCYVCNKSCGLKNSDICFRFFQYTLYAVIMFEVLKRIKFLIHFTIEFINSTTVVDSSLPSSDSSLPSFDSIRNTNISVRIF